MQTLALYTGTNRFILRGKTSNVKCAERSLKLMCLWEATKYHTLKKQSNATHVRCSSKEHINWKVILMIFTLLENQPINAKYVRKHSHKKAHWRDMSWYIHPQKKNVTFAVGNSTISMICESTEWNTVLGKAWGSGLDWIVRHALNPLQMAQN